MSQDLTDRLPAGQETLDPEEVLRRLKAAAAEETAWESGLVFNTLCCRPHPLALRAFTQFADRNLLKEQSFAGRRMEQEVVAAYSTWFGAPPQQGRNGYVCSGGTEGNFVALWAAKAKHPGRRKVVLAKYAHYSYDRFAGPLELQLVPVPLRNGLEVDTGSFLDTIDGETLSVIITAGDPVLGRLDPVEDIVAAARRHDCAVHIDAAYGGYFLPFVPEYRERFGAILSPANNATTLTIDPHKYGLCPLGTGIVLFSGKEDLDRISLSVPFPPIESRTFQGSRSAGPAAAAWAMLQLLGTDGYRRLAEDVLAKCNHLATRLAAFPELEIVGRPRMTSVGFHVKAGEEQTIALYNKLSARGFLITPQTKPTFFLRAIVHHHTMLAHIEHLIEAIHDAM
jgi:tyrosine decarboxylase / aspartate 1-decarboxylase